MEFNDLLFIFIFLPLFTILFYVLKGNKYVVLSASVLFYILSDFKYIWLLALVIAASYYFGLNVKENKKLYLIYFVLMLVLLFGFKYFDILAAAFNTKSIVKVFIPIGISYYLFESISYVSDCYYGKYEAEKDIKNVAMYISFFPTIISGPIIRYDDFKEFLIIGECSFDSIAKGLRRFIIGLGKKIIIANMLANLYSVTFGNIEELTIGLSWVGLIAYAVRLYYDFSGCSDMAIGIGQMIGYDIPENFNDPYCSLSVSEFYRRWHMTLGSWFKDYIYIPLGGNRVSEGRLILNIMIVWLFTGAWHGSTVNYIIWGLFLGLFVVLEKKFISKLNIPSYLMWIYTVIVILFSWLIFASPDMNVFSAYLNTMFYGKKDTVEHIRTLGIIYIVPSFLAGIIFMIPRVKKCILWIEDKVPYVYDVLIVAVFVLSVVLMVTGTQVSSIYFSF